MTTGPEQSVQRFDGATGKYIDTFVEPGSGELGFASVPIFGPDGNLYVSSNDNARVLRYDGESGGFIDTFIAKGSGGLLGPTYMIFHDFDAGAVPGRGMAIESMAIERAVSQAAQPGITPVHVHAVYATAASWTLLSSFSTASTTFLASNLNLATNPGEVVVKPPMPVADFDRFFVASKQEEGRLTRFDLEVVSANGFSGDPFEIGYPQF